MSMHQRLPAPDACKPLGDMTALARLSELAVPDSVPFSQQEIQSAMQDCSAPLMSPGELVTALKVRLSPKLED